MIVTIHGQKFSGHVTGPTREVAGVQAIPFSLDPPVRMGSMICTTPVEVFLRADSINPQQRGDPMADREKLEDEREASVQEESDQESGQDSEQAHVPYAAPNPGAGDEVTEEDTQAPPKPGE
jgi:hypothetical protein